MVKKKEKGSDDGDEESRYNFCVFFAVLRAMRIKLCAAREIAHGAQVYKETLGESSRLEMASARWRAATTATSGGSSGGGS